MQMNDIYQVILVAGFIVLLPLIPAFLLYKFLPSRTHVSGPFKGFTVQLTGAFAGYFVMVLLTAGYVSSQVNRMRIEAQNATPVLWTIAGMVQLEGGNASQDVGSIEWTFRPPAPPRPMLDGHFEIADVPFLKGPRATTTSLVVSRTPGFEPVALLFEDDSVAIGETRYALKYDSAAKRITISPAIVLRRVTAPYSPAANAQLTIRDTVGGPP